MASTKGMWLSDDTQSTLTLRRSSGPSLVYAERLAVMPSGRILMTGIDPTQPHILLEVSDDGGETWRRTAPLPEPVEGSTGAVTLVVVGGQTALAVTGRGLIYRTDDDGETWTVVGRSPMPSGDHHATHALLDSQDRLLVSLFRRGPSIEDTWIWRTSLPQVVADQASPSVLPETRVTVSPNPSHAGTVTVGVALSGPSADVRVEVYDAVGRRVAVLHQGEAVGALRLDLDTSAWAPGVYTVRVVGAGAVGAETFTVVR